MSDGLGGYVRELPDRCLVFVSLLAFASVHSVVRIAFYYAGWRGFWYDAGEFWYPIAERLSEGAVLYAEAYDNKTPLWHALNYLVYRTDHYALVFYALVGVANAAVGYLLYRWLSRNGYRRGGLVAAALYLAAVPLMNGDIVNVRSFSLAFLLAGVLEERPLRRGGYVAVAVLFSQVTAVAVPVLLLDGLRGAEANGRWGLWYVAAGAVTGAIPYLALAVVYDPQTMLTGIEATFLSGGEYILEHADYRNPFLYPHSWARGLVVDAQSLAFVLVPGAGTLASIHVSATQSWDRVTGLSAVLAVVFFATVLAKALTYYWMPVVVFAAALSGCGVERWLRRSGS